MRVAEGCEPREGYIRTPIYRFDDNGKGYPDIMEFDASDPEVIPKDTRTVVYKGREYLTSLSHIRIARSKDGINFKVDDAPFIYPENETERYGVEDARITFIDGNTTSPILRFPKIPGLLL